MLILNFFLLLYSNKISLWYQDYKWLFDIDIKKVHRKGLKIKNTLINVFCAIYELLLAFCWKENTKFDREGEYAGQRWEIVEAFRIFFPAAGTKGEQLGQERGVYKGLRDPFEKRWFSFHTKNAHYF